MQKYVLYLFLGLVSFIIYSDSNSENTDSNSHFLKEVMLKNTYSNIVGVTQSEKDTFVIFLTGQPDSPLENHLGIITCDVKGNILEDDIVIYFTTFINTTNEPNYPAIWISAKDHLSPLRLWLATWEGGKIKPIMLLKEEEVGQLLYKCWFLKAEDKEKIFLETYDPVYVPVKGENQMINVHWLYCYELENGKLKLNNKAKIAEGKTESDEFEAECGLIDGEIYVWVCEKGGQWSEGLLRVAKWRNNGELEWSTCYKSTKGHNLKGLIVNKTYGCTSAVLEYDTREGTQPSAIVCRRKSDATYTFNLVQGFTSKNQIVPINTNDIAFFISGYEGWNIAALDDKLQLVDVIRPNFRRTADFYITQDGNQEVYITMLSEDNKITIEKLGRFSEKQEKVNKNKEKTSEEEMEALYDEYLKGDGKVLLKASDDQLAKDIVSGSRQSFSPLISYYRLLSRDKTRAKECLSIQIEMIVQSGVGKEHWITEMELILYEELAVDPLLRIAEDGTIEQRQIAIAFLSMVPYSGVTDKLIKLLDRPDIRGDSIAFIAICEKGARDGRAKAIDFLIKQATSTLISAKDIETTNLLNKSRQLLIEIFRDYNDTPEDWSDEKWNEWWKKHKDGWKPEEKGQSQQLLLHSEKSRNKFCQEVAQRIEKELKKQTEPPK